MELVVRHGEREETVRVEATDAGYRVTVGGRSYEVDLAHPNATLKSLVIDGRQYEVTVHPRGDGSYWVTSGAGAGALELMDPLTHLAREAHREAAGSGRQRVVAYMPGRVAKVLVEEGATVEAGQGVVVLEAMKMENEIDAEGAGTVVKIHVREGQAVEGGDLLFEVAR